jgi:hypothetical protein
MSRLNVTETFLNTPLASVPFLPKRYVFKNGLTAIVRQMAKHEDVVVYGLFKSSCDESKGYGYDEFVTLDSFRYFMLLDRPCIVFENEANGEVTQSFDTY